MSSNRPTRTGWSRRDMLRGSAAAIMGISGLAPRYGLAADIPYRVPMGQSFRWRHRKPIRSGAA